MNRGRLYFPLLLAVVAWGASAAQGQTDRTVHIPNLPPTRHAPFAFDTLRTIGWGENVPREQAFAAITAIAGDAESRIFVADMMERNVRVFDAAGRYVTTLGRAGEGPGEFMVPTKVSVAPDGTIFVFDQQSNRVTEFSRLLAFVRSVRLSLPVRASGFVATDDRLILSGSVADSSFRNSAIHVFDRSSGALIRSFGHLPPGLSYPTLPSLIDVGRITRGRDGSLWYAQPAPYLVERYSVDGALLLQIARENAFLPATDSSVRIAVSGSRVTFSSRPRPRAVIAKELRDGSLVVQVALPDGSVISDLYSFSEGPTGPAPRLRFSWVGATPILSEQLAADLFVTQVGGREDKPYGVAVVRMRPVR